MSEGKAGSGLRRVYVGPGMLLRTSALLVPSAEGHGVSAWSIDLELTDS
jgi:hypothetical protein